MKDSIQTIRRSSRRFFSGTMLSRITGMARDMSMAYAFGTQPSVAAFMVAFRFAHLLRRLFGEGALQSAFIPQFEALRHQSEERAFSFFRSLTFTLTVFLILVIALGCGAIACFMWLADVDPGDREILLLTLIMLPSLLFICLFGINASLLQCERYYFTPSVAPAAFNLIWIGFIFCLQGMAASDAMPWLSIGVVAACVFQWLITARNTKKCLIAFIKLPLWETLRTAAPDLRRLGKPLLLGILGVGASQINNAVDSLFARFADTEGPALLWYAIRIQQLPLALFGIAIAGAILPPLSRALKGQRREEYQHFLHDALSQTWMLMLPLTGTLFVMGDLSIHFLYGRGDFNDQAVIQTTYCLWAYGIGLIPTALLLVLAPACYAQNNYRLPAIASFLAMGVNLLLNSLFIMYFGWGAVSVALATSISSWINLLLIGVRMHVEYALLPSRALIGKGLIIMLVTICATWGTYEVRLQLQQLPFFSPLIFSSTAFQQAGLLLFQAGTFFMIFFVLYFLLRGCLLLTDKRFFLKHQVD